MDKSKRPFPIRKSNQSFRRRLPPIQPGDRIDYRNISLLSQFISDQGKILSRGRNKVTLKQQRLITIAIKQARILSLLPFINNGLKSQKLMETAKDKVKPDTPIGVKSQKFMETAKNKVKPDTPIGVKRNKLMERARNKVKSNFT